MPLERRSSSTVLTRSRSKPTSSKTLKLLCFAPTAEDTRNLPSPRVPLEIVEYIVELALAHSTDSNITDFGAIAPLTLASMDFRHIALRQFFREVIPLTKPHWAKLFQFLALQNLGQGGKGGYDWVKWVYARNPLKVLLDKKPQGFLRVVKNITRTSKPSDAPGQAPSAFHRFGTGRSLNATSVSQSSLLPCRSKSCPQPEILNAVKFTSNRRGPASSNRKHLS